MAIVNLFVFLIREHFLCIVWYLMLLNSLHMLNIGCDLI